MRNGGHVKAHGNHQFRPVTIVTNRSLRYLPEVDLNFCIKGPSLSKVAGTNELGSLIALANLHKRYDAWLQSRLIRIFGRSSAEDIAQQTWLAIARSDAAMAVQNPKAFLLTVARNAAYDDVRKGRRVSAADDLEIGSLSVPDDQLEAVFLRQVILSLPQPLRDVFVLSRFGGLTNAQIAEHLGIRPKTVEWRMTKALAHCAAQYRR